MEPTNEEARKALPALEDCKKQLLNALLSAPIGSFNMRHFSYNILKRPLSAGSKYLSEVTLWIDGIEEIPYFLKEILEEDARHPIQQRVNSGLDRFRREAARKEDNREKSAAYSASDEADTAAKAAQAEVEAAKDLVREAKEKVARAKAEAKRRAEEATNLRKQKAAERRAEKEAHQRQYEFREKRKLELVREYILNSNGMSLMRWRENLSNEDQDLIGYQSLLLCYNTNKERITKELEEQKAFEAKRLADEAEKQRLEAEAEAKRLADEEAARIKAEEDAKAAERAAIAKANADAMVQALKDAGLLDSIVQVEEANALAKENRDKMVNNVSPAISRLERQVQVLKAWMKALMQQQGYKFPTTIETGERIDYSKDPSINTF